MQIHITKICGMAGAALLAQDGVVEAAKRLGAKELFLEHRSFYDDYWNTINHNLDGAIAALNFNDIVIFQYPSWNSLDYDMRLVEKIRAYSGTKLVIFVHDFQQLMFDSGPHILEREICLLNTADALILPSKTLHQYLKQHGLRKELPANYQVIFEMPGFPCFTEHANLRRFCFTGNYQRFPFLLDYHGKTVLEYFDGQKPSREDDASLCWKGYYTPVELMQELARGGYGLVWSGKEYFDRYYSLNQPHKLGFNLSAGIPVIIRAGGTHEDLVRRNGLGFVVNSLNEADEKIQNTTDKEYAQLCSNVRKMQQLMLQGWYTQKLLLDTLIPLMER